jgi:hypothetical protein
MAPLTHLLGSWVIGATGTNNRVDCRLVALAGILRDLDGLGLLLDAFNAAVGRKSLYYLHYHHYLLHGWFGAVLISALLVLFAGQRWRVFLLCLFVFHLHLLCDFVGSRGPSKEDVWPLFYHGPFGKDPMWLWYGQWQLDSWINRILTLALFGLSLGIALRKGYSWVGVFSPRLDRIFVETLRKWEGQIRAHRAANPSRDS